MPKSALHAFSGKVKDKLTTTLGLFISISGFADECIRRENSNIILMDYQDIILVIMSKRTVNLLSTNFIGTFRV